MMMTMKKNKKERKKKKAYSEEGRMTYVYIRGSVYRKCAAYDKTDSLAVRAPRRHSRFHAVYTSEPPWLKTGISCFNVHYINEEP